MLMDRIHPAVRPELGKAADFVLHSLCHTMLTCLGERGADAFTVQRTAGRHRVTMSRRYAHPTRDVIEARFVRFEAVHSTQPEATSGGASSAKTAPVLADKCEVSCDATGAAASWRNDGPLAQW